MSALRVAVSGAGLGGLVLAHGLRRAGVDVTVHERDASLSARQQGYRLHLDDDGLGALESVLPAAGLAELQATSGTPAPRFVRLDHATLDVRHIADMTGRHRAVDRFTLRRILLDGLDGVVGFGQEVQRYETARAGRPVVLLGDGTRIEADVLVGADGVHSPVRRQRLPQQQIVDTNARMLYGAVALDASTRPLFRETMRSVFTAITGPRRTMLGVAPVEFPQPPAGRSAYATCSYGFRPDVLGVSDDDLHAMSPQEMHAMMRAGVAGWHPEVEAIVDAVDPASVFALTLRQCVPIPPWEPGPVTFVGDAIHAMSPGAGAGANTAMRDGARLAAALSRVAEGAPLVPAVGAYEADMIGNGFAAVRRGAANGAWTLGQDPLPDHAGA